MFGWFKKKSEKEKLEELYALLTKESFELSKVDRVKSDEKMVKANAVLKRLEKLS